MYNFLVKSLLLEKNSYKMRAGILFLLILIFLPVFSQEKRVQNLPDFENRLLHFGFTVGVNSMNFGISKDDNFFSQTKFNQIYSIECQTIPGFFLGPVTDLHMGEYFDLRLLINISFGQRNLKYLMIEDTTSLNPTLTSHTMQLSSTYFEFPLLIKYKSKRLNNFRPYLIAGINPKIDLAAQKKIKEAEMPKIRLKRFDLAWEAGFGIDFYLPYFKFSPELKYSCGIKDMVARDGTQFTSSIKKLNSNVWMFSLHFEGSF
jgi:hypothetical protein